MVVVGGGDSVKVRSIDLQLRQERIQHTAAHLSQGNAQCVVVVVVDVVEWLRLVVIVMSKSG